MIHSPTRTPDMLRILHGAPFDTHSFPLFVLLLSDLHIYQLEQVQRPELVWREAIETENSKLASAARGRGKNETRVKENEKPMEAACGRAGYADLFWYGKILGVTVYP